MPNEEKAKMKILWVVSFPLPAVAHLINKEKIPFGGWVTTMLQQLSKVNEFEIAVVMKSPVDEVVKSRIDEVDYYLLPQSKKDRFDVYQSDCDFVLNDADPDLLQAEGTEGSHTLRFLQTWNGNNLVSMQGILKAYEPYEYGHLPIADFIAGVKGQSALMSIALLVNKLMNFKKRVAKEVQAIKLAKNILGRTTWDKAHSYAINPNAKYHLCYRILREPFYQIRWSYDKAKPFSIFIGNSYQPRKGVHIVFEAVAQLKSEYPHIQVIIAGEKIVRKSWKEWKKFVGYPAYLQKLAKRLGVEKHIHYTGVLQAEDMAIEMSSAHICVLSSIIENSPNTLGEAMIMGVPTVTSYVGGAPDMAIDGEETLFYRANDPQLLAYSIKRIFDDKKLAQMLSENGRKRAVVTHNPDENLNRMIQIYRELNKGKS